MDNTRLATILSIAALAIAVVAFVQGRGQKVPEAYVPGLGEIMTLQQMRHAKLALAGGMANWQLADYETDELNEGFEDMVKFHPTHEKVPKPLTELVPQYADGPLKDLRAAIEAKDTAKFDAAFDALTAGCNGCHEAANFKFNRVIRPTAPPVPNQDFRPN